METDTQTVNIEFRFGEKGEGIADQPIEFVAEGVYISNALHVQNPAKRHLSIAYFAQRLASQTGLFVRWNIQGNEFGRVYRPLINTEDGAGRPLADWMTDGAASGAAATAAGEVRDDQIPALDRFGRWIQTLDEDRRRYAVALMDHALNDQPFPEIPAGVHIPFLSHNLIKKTVRTLADQIRKGGEANG